MATTTLNLELPEATYRKLRALAMLSGSTVEQLQVKLVNHFDQLLNDECAEALGMIGSPVAHINGGVQIHRAPERAVTAPYVPNQTDLSDSEHGLSGDEDDGRDLTPQISEEGTSIPDGVQTAGAAQDEDDGTGIPNRPFEIATKIPMAGKDGGDAEAFIEAAMSTPRRKAAVTEDEVFLAPERASKVVKSFQKARVNIQEYTGDE